MHNQSTDSVSPRGTDRGGAGQRGPHGREVDVSGSARVVSIYLIYPRQGCLVRALDLRITRYMYPFEYPFAPTRVVDVFVEYYGPTHRAYASLNDDGRRALRDGLTALWSRNNIATDGTTRVQAEYIEIVGTRS